MGGNAIKSGNVAYEVKWVLMGISKFGFLTEFDGNGRKFLALQASKVDIRIPLNLNNYSSSLMFQAPQFSLNAKYDKTTNQNSITLVFLKYHMFVQISLQNPRENAKLCKF